MCIIMYAPSKVNISKESMENAFEYNHDGAGVMFYDKKGNVHYKKGFTNFDELWNYWDSLGDSLPRAVHCRIATSGKISAKTCHPFPIVDKVEDMGKDEGSPKNGCLMHNGIFTKYTPKDGMKCEFSDSMYYTAKVIYPLKDIIMNEGVLRLLQDMTSRVLLFLPKFKILKFGSWQQDKKEKFYASNDSYEDKYYYGVYGGWGDYATTYPYTTKTYGKGLSGRTYYSSSGSYSYDEDNKIIPVKSSWLLEDKTDNYSQGQFMLSIIINAKDYVDAQSMMEEFMDDFYELLADDDMPYETLQEIDTNLWEFCVETYTDIERFVQNPYMVGYKYSLRTED